jgi:hypothetical protein
VAREDERRIGLLLFENEIDRAARLGEFGRDQPGLTKFRRESGGDQQRIPLAQRNVERCSEARDHVRARPRPTGFEKTHMPRRHARFQCARELTQMAMQAPVAQHRSERRAIARYQREGRRDGRFDRIGAWQF